MKKNTIEVSSAIYVDEYKIKISFHDGTSRLVNFHNFLKKSLNPSIQEYLDLKKIKSFVVKNGQLMWGDFDLIFPSSDLYNGSL